MDTVRAISQSCQAFIEQRCCKLSLEEKADMIFFCRPSLSAVEWTQYGSYKLVSLMWQDAAISL